MGDKSCYEDNWQNNPMASQIVKDNIADCDGTKKCGIEPEEHPHMIRRPKIFDDPLHKAPIYQRFVQDMKYI